jgi:hypothetical protein
MQAETLGALAWIGLIFCYAWSVRNLARLGRRSPASDAGARSIRIVVDTGRRPGRTPAVGAAEPKRTSRRRASGSPT